MVPADYAGRWKGLFEHLIAAKGIAVSHPDLDSVLSRTTNSQGHSSQAIESAIGQAIALENLATLYNKPDLELLDSMVWCIIDDPKFQQGSALDAVALAGSWKLSSLCVIYDGTYDTVSDNIEVDNFKTHGWNVLELVSDENLTITCKLCQCTSRDD